jgi:hypothetical protein
MEKVKLKAVIKKEFEVHLSFFSPNGNGTSGSTLTFDTDTSLSDIRKKVLKEGEERENTRNEMLYCYWVNKVEVMTDNRSKKYGHIMSPSKKVLRENINGFTYVRGAHMSVDEVLKQMTNEKTRIRFDIFLHKHFSKNNDLTEEQLATSVMMIPGDVNKENFFEIFNEKDLVLNSFASDKFVA